MSLSLCLVVKRAGRSLAATSVTGQTHLGRLFYIHDVPSNTRFLVDTGAEVSVVPPSCTERSHRQDTFNLQAVNGSQIATFGVRSLTLNLGLRRTFRWVFIVADVKQPILSADFQQHFGLHVDMRHRTLSDSATSLQVHGLSSSQPSSTGITHSLQNTSNPFLRLKSEFPAVTLACASDRPLKHNVTHHITTTSQTMFTRTRRLAPERLQIARQEFDHMFELGIIRPSSSSWSSSLHMVPKSAPGDWRPCGDFHALNNACLTGTWSPISRTLRPHSREPLSSHTLTLSGRTIRSQ